MESQCHFGAHKAWMMVLFGVLLLINATWNIVSWPLLIGFIAIVFGILMLVFHGCCCRKCNCNTSTNQPMQQPIKKK